MAKPSEVNVKIGLSGPEISGTWVIDDVQAQAAWELYVELTTRVTIVPLEGDTGLLREALTSLYSLFPTTREILRRAGPKAARPKRKGALSIGVIAILVLNRGIRPFLAKWHPRLTDWEAKRPKDTAPADHERSWEHAKVLRTELAEVQGQLKTYVEMLEGALGIPAPGSFVD